MTHLKNLVIKMFTWIVSVVIGEQARGTISYVPGIWSLGFVKDKNLLEMGCIGNNVVIARLAFLVKGLTTAGNTSDLQVKALMRTSYDFQNQIET